MTPRGRVTSPPTWTTKPQLHAQRRANALKQNRTRIPQICRAGGRKKIWQIDSKAKRARRGFRRPKGEKTTGKPDQARYNNIPSIFNTCRAIRAAVARTPRSQGTCAAGRCVNWRGGSPPLPRRNAPAPSLRSLFAATPGPRAAPFPAGVTSYREVTSHIPSGKYPRARAGGLRPR